MVTMGRVRSSNGVDVRNDWSLARDIVHTIFLVRRWSRNWVDTQIFWTPQNNVSSMAARRSAATHCWRSYCVAREVQGCGFRHRSSRHRRDQTEILASWLPRRQYLPRRQGQRHKYHRLARGLEYSSLHWDKSPTNPRLWGGDEDEVAWQFQASECRWKRKASIPSLSVSHDNRLRDPDSQSKSTIV